MSGPQVLDLHLHLIFDNSLYTGSRSMTGHKLILLNSQISVECNFGSLIAYLSPIQAHIVYKLIDELMNPVTR
jgi:hypothetical protein